MDAIDRIHYGRFGIVRPLRFPCWLIDKSGMSREACDGTIPFAPLGHQVVSLRKRRANMNDELLERRHATRQIDYFVTQHSLSFFRNNRPDQSADNARTLHHHLQVIHRGDPAMVVTEMRAIADRIAKFDLLPGGSTDGHHEQAAEAIRAFATEIEKDQCPWSELYPLFGNHRILRALAQTLWKHNGGNGRQWSVSLDAVAEEVWGEPATNRSTIRSTVSRLVTWLGERGVLVEFSVSDPARPGVINCQVVHVDEDRVKQACDQGDLT